MDFTSVTVARDVLGAAQGNVKLCEARVASTKDELNRASDRLRVFEETDKTWHQTRVKGAAVKRRRAFREFNKAQAELVIAVKTFETVKSAYDKYVSGGDN